MSNPVVDLSISNNSTGAASRLSHDLSVTPKIPGLTITPSVVPVPVPTEASTSATNSDSRYGSRRVLRPRTEAKCYAEDIAALNGKGTYVATDSPDEDEEMIPLYQVKELSAAEIWERERELRKLREELRNEETKLVLLKKIKHSQQLLKENINKNVSGLPQNILQNLPNTSLNPVSIIPQGLSKNSSLSVTPTNLSDYKNNTTITRQTSLDPSTSVFPLPRQSLPGGATLTTGVSSRNPILHGRNTNNISITPSVTITPTSAPSLNMKNKNLPSSNSVSITPAASITISQNNSLSSNLSDQSSRNDTQTAAQKQAAAKLALRKQLEKTLLQIPPPKPPPPEMNFIPNPNNGEFVYLIGLEHVVDYLTCKEKKTPQQQMPFRCAQCKIDFTPVWKLEKEKRGGSSESAPKKDTRIICEQCVTTNVKKALKAEHTNRLKTAFVKALQQEQEIEQRIATQAASASQSAEYSAPQAQISSHQSASAPISLSQSPVPLTVTKTPSSTPRPTPTPPNQSTPPPQSQSSSRSSRQQQQQQHNDNMASLSFAAQLGALSNLANLGNLGGLGNLGNLGNLANLGNLGNLANLGNLGNLGNLANLNSSAQQTAAAMQAFQQQLFRGLQQGLSSNNPANLAAHMQFNPLLYSYQLALAQAQAQAAQVTKGSGKTPSMAEIQRAMELQRQYLLEMMPQGSVPNSRQNNWKNN